MSEPGAKKSWVMVDVGNSAFATTILAAVFPIYFPNLLPKHGLAFHFFGWEWTSNPISIWAYSVSGSIFIALLISPIIGAWADEKGKRKKLLGIFTVIGSIASVGLGIFTTWQVVLPCFAIAYICFSSSNVFYNSLLPAVAEEKDWHKLSLAGYAWGYFGGGVLLAINLLMITKYEWFGLESKVLGTRLSFMSVGLWWIVFTVPALIHIEERAREVLPTDLAQKAMDRLKQLWTTAKDLPKYPSLFLFICAFAFFNDGIQTVISMSSIYGKEVVQLNEGTLIGTLLMIQFLGLPFTLLMNNMANKFGSKKTLMTSLLFWMVIVCFAFFMTQARDFWILGVMVAIVLGVSQALPRSLFAELIPEGRHAEFYAVYAFSGKLTSIMGPLVFGIIQDLSGSSRLAILSLGAFFIIGILLLSFVKFPQKAPPKSVIELS